MPHPHGARARTRTWFRSLWPQGPLAATVALVGVFNILEGNQIPPAFRDLLEGALGKEHAP